MNILDAVGISLPCRSCGDNYQVPWRDVLRSHNILQQSCLDSPETECHPVFHSRLFGRKDIDEIRRACRPTDNKDPAEAGGVVHMGATGQVGGGAAGERLRTRGKGRPG